MGLGVCSHESGKGRKKIVTGKPTRGRRHKAITVPVWDVIPKERGRCSGKEKRGHLLYTNLPMILVLRDFPQTRGITVAWSG